MTTDPTTQLDRFQLLRISEGGQSGMAGPTYRRIDCAIPGIGVETWGCLVEFGGTYLLKDLCPQISAGGNPPMFNSIGEAVDWLVTLINGAPVAVEARAALDRIAAAEAAKTEAARAEELARARAVVEAAEKRARDSEVT